MARSRIPTRRPIDRPIVTVLWVAAASIFILGNVMRVAASEWTGYHLRITGVYLIALGLVVGIFAWVGERIIARRGR
jgi:hypothetical protein